MSNVDIDDLAAAVMEGLEEYVELAEDTMKDAVTQTAKAVRKELVTTSPDGKTGRYRKGIRSPICPEFPRNWRCWTVAIPHCGN